jgi:hypothetical protein
MANLFGTPIDLEQVASVELIPIDGTTAERIAPVPPVLASEKAEIEEAFLLAAAQSPRIAMLWARIKSISTRTVQQGRNMVVERDRTAARYRRVSSAIVRLKRMQYSLYIEMVRLKEGAPDEEGAQRAVSGIWTEIIQICAKLRRQVVNLRLRKGPAIDESMEGKEEMGPIEDDSDLSGLGAEVDGGPLDVAERQDAPSDEAKRTV